MSGFRRRSIHRKRPEKSNEEEEADDEEYDRTARSNSIAEHSGDGQRASVAETPTLDLIISEEDIQGFHSKFTDKRLEKLPAITKDKDIKKQRKMFIAKMEQCCVVFDFSRKHGPIANPAELAASKMVKRNALNEGIEFVSTNKGSIDADTFQAIVQVVSANCFRTFEQADDPTAPPFDPEDDEPILETGWPHLQLVYSLFLKALDQKALTSDLFLRIAGTEFVSRMIGNMGSCDPRERDSAKSCVHRAYGRFMPVRAFVRKILKETMIRVAFEDNTAIPFHGTTELLEFYGCIVNGFVSPIKDEHKALLIGGLLPLHRCKPLSTYHRQLVYCITQFLSKAPDMVEDVFPYLLSHWPKNNAPKELLYINEMEAIMRVIDVENLDSVFPQVCRRVAKCAQSVHFMVAERALGFWNNPIFLNQVRKDLHMSFPILAPALHYNNKRHWSGSIHDHNDNAIEVMNEIDPDLFMELAPPGIQSEAADKEAVRSSVESKWDKLLTMAKQNPLVRNVEVIEGVPLCASAVPDVFMKGETTSPHRQYRLHKRTNQGELDAVRHPLDVAARARAEREEEEEEAMEAASYDDDDGDDGDVVMRRPDALAEAVSPTGTVPSNPRTALTRRKSTLLLPNHTEVEKELADFHPEQMAMVPPSPLTSPFATPIPSDDDMVDEIDGPVDGKPSTVENGFVPPPPSFESVDPPTPDEEEGTVPLPKVAGPHDSGCWLVKRSAGTFKRSNRRWFAIEKDAARIAYYTQETGVGLPVIEPRGFIPFRDIMKVGQSNRQLVIVSSKRPKFTLTAPTTAVSQQWAQMLTAALQEFDAKAQYHGNGHMPEPEILISDMSNPANAATSATDAAPTLKRRNSGEYGFSPDGTPLPSPTSPNPPQQDGPQNGTSANVNDSDPEYGFGGDGGDEYVGEEWDLEA